MNIWMRFKKLLQCKMLSLERPVKDWETDFGYENNYSRCKICNESYTNNIYLTKHMEKHTSENPLSCKVCMKTFGYKCNLTNHMKIHTGGKIVPFLCSVCNRGFVVEQKFEQHMRDHVNDNSYLYADCEKHFSSEEEVVSHKKTHHALKDFPCAVCKKTFQDKQTLKRHMITHRDDRSLSCVICHKSFQIDNTRRSNMKWPANEYDTSDCVLAETTGKTGLEKHMTSHTVENIAFCNICGEILRERSMQNHMRTVHFTESQDLNSHERNQTEKMPYSCVVCRKEFCFAHLLERHMEDHLGKKLFFCDVCDKVFTQKTDLSQHKRIHTKAKQFYCEKCEKQFQRTNKHDRLALLHMERQSSCSICSKSFAHTQYLKEHMKIHSEKDTLASDVGQAEVPDDHEVHWQMKTSTFPTDGALYGCRECGTVFVQMKNLLLHQKKVHTSKIPFSCGVCGRICKQEQELIIHMKEHSSGILYLCNVCKETFTLKSDLNVHLANHEKGPLLSCGVCKESFSKEKDTINHMKTHMDVGTVGTGNLNVVASGVQDEHPIRTGAIKSPDRSGTNQASLSKSYKQTHGSLNSVLTESFGRHRHKWQSTWMPKDKTRDRIHTWQSARMSEDKTRDSTHKWQSTRMPEGKTRDSTKKEMHRTTFSSLERQGNAILCCVCKMKPMKHCLVVDSGVDTVLCERCACMCMPCSLCNQMITFVYLMVHLAKHFGRL